MSFIYTGYHNEITDTSSHCGLERIYRQQLYTESDQAYTNMYF